MTLSSQKTSTATDEAPPPPPAPAAPVTSLPTLAMLAGIASGALAIGALGYMAAMVLRPGTEAAALAGAGCSILAHSLILTGLAPWKARSLAKWPFAILFGSVVALVVVLSLLILLYSATPLDGVTLALSIAATWFAGFMAEVAVYGRFVKAVEGRRSAS